jgi:flagellar biosynthesis protein FliR
MSSVVLGSATTFTFTEATDSQSVSYGEANVCGGFLYTVSPTTFLSVDGQTRVITLQSTDMAAVGTYTATLTATLTLYPAVPAAT